MVGEAGRDPIGSLESRQQLSGKSALMERLLQLPHFEGHHPTSGHTPPPVVVPVVPRFPVCGRCCWLGSPTVNCAAVAHSWITWSCTALLLTCYYHANLASGEIRDTHALLKIRNSSDQEESR